MALVWLAIAILAGIIIFLLVRRAVRAARRAVSRSLSLLTGALSRTTMSQQSTAPTKPQLDWRAEMAKTTAEDSPPGKPKPPARPPQVHDLSCPNCSAPLSGTGVVTCEYCHSTVVVD
jgi:hypothetical protein